jgi:phosphoenolpyruvate synthase/pyruvate phosphate dikinase
MEVGNKVRGLEKLSEAGVMVPPYQVMRMPRASVRPGFADQARQHLQLGWHSFTRFCEDAQIDLSRWLPSVPDWVAGGHFMVRSSSVEEDTATHSFAGQFSSFPVAPGQKIWQVCVEVYRSMLGPRAVRYRLYHDIPFDNLELAVIVQERVCGHEYGGRLGVYYSKHPVLGVPAIESDDEQLVDKVGHRLQDIDKRIRRKQDGEFIVEFACRPKSVEVWGLQLRPMPKLNSPKLVVDKARFPHRTFEGKQVSPGEACGILTDKSPQPGEIALIPDTSEYYEYVLYQAAGFVATHGTATSHVPLVAQEIGVPGIVVPKDLTDLVGKEVMIHDGAVYTMGGQN